MPAINGRAGVIPHIQFRSHRSGHGASFAQGFQGYELNAIGVPGQGDRRDPGGEAGLANASHPVKVTNRFRRSRSSTPSASVLSPHQSAQRLDEIVRCRLRNLLAGFPKIGPELIVELRRLLVGSGAHPS